MLVAGPVAGGTWVAGVRAGKTAALLGRHKKFSLKLQKIASLLPHMERKFHAAIMIVSTSPPRSIPSHILS